MSFMSNIGWPVIVNIISAALLTALGLFFKVVPKLTKSIAKTINAQNESETPQITGNSDVDYLIKYLSKGGHSFDWLREKPIFEKYTD